jgi:hypothetical protein
VFVCRIKGWIKDSEGWGEANGLKNKELTCSMGLEWREVYILAQVATIPNKVF